MFLLTDSGTVLVTDERLRLPPADATAELRLGICRATGAAPEAFEPAVHRSRTGARLRSLVGRESPRALLGRPAGEAIQSPVADAGGPAGRV